MVFEPVLFDVGGGCKNRTACLMSYYGLCLNGCNAGPCIMVPVIIRDSTYLSLNNVGQLPYQRPARLRMVGHSHKDGHRLLLRGPKLWHLLTVFKQDAGLLEKLATERERQRETERDRGTEMETQMGRERESQKQ